MKKSISLEEDSNRHGSNSNMKDKLYVERVGLAWMNRFKKNRDWNDISINLLNPSFNNIHYNALRIKFVRRKNDDIFLIDIIFGCVRGLVLVAQICQLWHHRLDALV